jgi:transcriptional regulator with XRE-family HTH domain
MPHIAGALGIPIDTGVTQLRRELQLARRYVQLAHAQEAHHNAVKKTRHSVSPSFASSAGSPWSVSVCRTRTIGETSRANLSNIEHGLVVPTVPTLRKIAAKVAIDLPYLVTFPEESKHQALIERTRFMSVAEVEELLKARARSRG